MNLSARNGIPVSTSDLARIPLFRIGVLEIEPAALRIAADGATETLEPKVMRVLVTLASTPGQVYSREDLLELCWDGQVVGDNAISRVISLLRRALDTVSGGAVRLQTITKVGFTIIVDEPIRIDVTEAPPSSLAELDAPAPLPPRRWSRRLIVGGAVVAGVSAVAGYRFWTGSDGRMPDPQALDLYQRGQLIQKSGEPGGMRQAMAYYEQAVEIDPGYADAWGALAIGYRHGGDGFIKGPREAYVRLVHSAAGRALELDADQPDARMALATIDSEFGRWGEHEVKLREIVRRSPDYWYGWAQLDLLMQNVGRFNEGVTYRRRMLGIDPMIPVAWALLARGLHYAGRDHEADFALRNAFERWPANSVLWRMRFMILIGGERYREAAAFARDIRNQPEDRRVQEIEADVRLAEALATGAGKERILAYLRKLSHLPVEAVPAFVPAIVRLGDVVMAFDWLRTYYFGGSLNGRPVPPPQSFEARDTAVLFSPPMLEQKDDVQFSRLLQETGLEAYWKKSGVQPDFRMA